MKITQFDDRYSVKLGQGNTTLVSGSSGGSNSGLGGDVSGSLGNVSVNGLRRSVSLGSNLGTGVAVGDTLTIISTVGTPVARFATPSNTGGGSFGSNATRVSASSFVGASANGAREDHRHDGIGTVTSSASNTLDRGTLNLRPGTNVAFALSDSDGSGGFDTVTISASATGGSGSGTAIDNWHYEIVAMLGSHGNTNWTTINLDNQEIYAADLESSGAQNDEIYWDIGLSGGTWDLTVLHFKGNNRGIYTISIDGVSIGTIDGYGAVATKNNLTAITGITISAGKRRLKLKMATKNASSSNYFGTISAIQLRRTA